MTKMDTLNSIVGPIHFSNAKQCDDDGVHVAQNEGSTNDRIVFLPAVIATQCDDDV